MSGAGSQFARELAGGAPRMSRSPQAHLLHAINQPLTGLQCSLELAVAGPRQPEQYVATLREGLELISRMRVLVEAVRELADIQPFDVEEVATFPLDELLRDTAADLLPIAESKNVELQLVRRASLPVRADRRRLAALMFRFLESVLSLAHEGSALQIVASIQTEKACIAVSWNKDSLPVHSPFSRQELGLLIAQSEWEQAGGEWLDDRSEKNQTCTLQLPLASGLTVLSPCQFGGLQ
jgi:C4-dicarboxylate-specific signal transduction histidine kinase